MDTDKLIGHKVKHVSWDEGTIIAADDKYVTVSYTGQGDKKYQFPKAFESFLKSMKNRCRRRFWRKLGISRLKKRR